MARLPGHVPDPVGSLGVLANGDFGAAGVSLTGLFAVLAAGGGALLLVLAMSHTGALVARLATAGRDTGRAGPPRRPPERRSSATGGPTAR